MPSYRVRLDFDPPLDELVRTRKEFEKGIVVFSGRRSLKDLVESLGIPHVEAGFMVLHNRSPVGFDYLLKSGDEIRVCPDLPPEWRTGGHQSLRPSAPRPLRFVADVHLGTLSRRLRLLGFDVVYTSRNSDRQLADISSGQHRILLTRDRGLLMRREIRYGMLIRNADPDDQLDEVARRFSLEKEAPRPFSRCLVCNGELVTMSPGEDLFRRLSSGIPEDILRFQKRFTTCRHCQQVYWPGSHYTRLLRIVRRILGTAVSER